MRIGVFSFYKEFNHQNKIFDPEVYTLADHLGEPIIYLRDYFKQQGHTLETLDMGGLLEFNAYLFLDFPSNDLALLRRLSAENKKMYLVLFESEMIKPDNYMVDNHHWFEKIFTYKPELVKLGGRYQLQLVPQHLENNFIPQQERFKKLVLIASKKVSKFPGELYSQRYQAIEYFDKNWNDQFDFFGFGWDRRVFNSRIVGKIAKLTRLDKVGAPSYLTYRGTVKRKSEVMTSYDFCLTFENSSIYENYVTEKLFDALNCGTLPIYWGAPNISELLPPDLYVDMRNFESWIQLKAFLASMSKEEIVSRREKIHSFLKDSADIPFSKQFFAHAISRTILSGFNN